jgi:hypothetical protein
MRIQLLLLLLLLLLLQAVFAEVSEYAAHIFSAILISKCRPSARIYAYKNVSMEVYAVETVATAGFHQIFFP